MWSYRVGSWKHLLVACLEPLRNQRLLTNVIVAATIIGIGGGISLMVGGGLGTGVLFAVGALLVVMTGTGLVRFHGSAARGFIALQGQGRNRQGCVSRDGLPVAVASCLRPLTSMAMRPAD